MNWGTKITIAFFAFGALLTTLVVISMNQEIDLVAEDYYKQEIEYQNRIDQMKNTAELDVKPSIELLDNRILLSFSEVTQAFESGTLHLFSPITEKEDQIFNLSTANFPEFEVDKTHLRKGNWTIKLEWKAAGKEFYWEENIRI